MEGYSNLLSKDPSKFSKSRSSSTFVIDTVVGDSFIQVNHPPQRSVRITSLNKKQEDERLILGFQYHEKVDGTPNATFLFIITATITNHSVTRIPVDDWRFCNLIYFRIFTDLGLRKQDLRLCEGQSHMAFNGSSTLLCG